MYKNKNGGFSLLELIVVIAIMAVLGGIVIGNSNYSCLLYTSPSPRD